MRLDRFLSDMGAATRSESKKLVRQGRVLINGAPAPGADVKLDPERDSVELDGARVEYKKRVCLMMNKPAGYLSSTEDGSGATVLELLPEVCRRRGAAPAGRLDKDAEGLLILTDDGELAHRVISPSKQVWKKYYVRCDGTPGAEDAEAFAAGLDAGGGLICKPARLEIIGEGECFVWLTEGKFHQVKRMMARIGKPVIYLKRVAIGALELDPALAAGEFRELSDGETELIFRNDM